jgi:hypothetical protein
LRLRGH